MVGFLFPLFTWLFHKVLIHICTNLIGNKIYFLAIKWYETQLRNGGSLNDNIWTLLFYLYLCHLLEFNSHLTGDPRSTEITNDYSPSTGLYWYNATVSVWSYSLLYLGIINVSFLKSMQNPAVAVDWIDLPLSNSSYILIFKRVSDG